MRFRFRKSFTIIPKVLHWTVSKKGASLNLRLGPYSKSWGTRGNSSTLDMPGTSGIFWRKQTSRKKRKAGDEELEAAAAGFHPWAEGKRWLLGGVILFAAVGYIQLGVHPLQTCALHGHPFIWWTVAVVLITIISSWLQRKASWFHSSGGALILLVPVAVSLIWLWNHLVASSQICS